MEEFLKSNELPHYLIKVVIHEDAEGKKHKQPFNIKNNLTKAQMDRQATRYIEENNLQNAEQIWCQCVQIKETEKPIYCFDVDEVISYKDVIAIYPFLQGTNYVRGNTKGFHFYLNIQNVPKYSNEVKVGYHRLRDIDLIRNKKNMWENITKKVKGECIKEYEWEDISKYFNTEAMNIEKTETKTETTTEKKKYELTDELLTGLIDCLSHTRAEESDTWRRIGACIYNEKKEAGLPYFIRFSRKSTQHNTSEEDLRRTYEDTCSKFNKLTLGTLIYYAKEDNREAFNKLTRKKMPECEHWTSYEWATYLAKELKDRIRYCRRKWYVCQSKLWKQVESPTYICVGEIKEVMKYNFGRLADLGDDAKKALMKLLLPMSKEIDRAGFHTQLKEHLKILCADDEFITVLYGHKERLIFKNGIVDMRTGYLMKEIVPEDYVPEDYMINWEFSNQYDEDHAKFIYDRLMEIHNNNKAQVDYILTTYGYALSGVMTEQILINIKGIHAGNGKTTITETLQNICPSLVSVLPKDILELNYSKRHKYLNDTWGKRILVFEELPANKKLDTSFLKQMTDGTLQNEVLYGTKETIPITFTIFSNTNHTPKFDVDAGLTRRYKEVNCDNKFHKQADYDKLGSRKKATDYLAIPNLKDKLVEMRNTFIHILMAGYRNYVEKGGIPEPDFITKWSEETMEINRDLDNKFDELYEITNDDTHWVAKKELLSMLGIKETEFKDFVKKLGLVYDSQARKSGFKGLVKGVQRRIVEEEDE